MKKGIIIFSICITISLIIFICLKVTKKDNIIDNQEESVEEEIIIPSLN